MEDKLVPWGRFGAMVTIRCTICRATFLTKNIGVPHEEEEMVGYISRTLHVVSVEGHECDKAGHSLEDCRIFKEDNLEIMEEQK